MTLPRPFPLRRSLAILALVLTGAVCGYAASSYKVTLPGDVSIGDTKLKSGEYSVSIQGKQAIFKKGKESTAVQVDVEKNPTKFTSTTLEMTGSTLKVINLGGTDTMLVFRPSH